MNLPAAAVVGGAWVLGAAAGGLALPSSPLLGAAAAGCGLAALAAAAVVRPVTYALALAAFLLGFARADHAASQPQLQGVAARLSGTAAVVEGSVVDDPRDIVGGYELLVAPRAVSTPDRRPIAGFGDLLVIAKGVRRAAFGDVVEVQGKLALPADLPGFDRRAYLAARGAWLEMRVQSVDLVRPGGGLPHVAAALRDAYRLGLDGLLPAPHAAVLEGVVLGVRTGIPSPLEQALIATGLIHLLVLSGLKVAVVARLVLWPLRAWLGRAATWPAIGLVGLYALVGGGTPAAVRAAVMGGLVLAGSRLGRPAHVWNSLAITAAAMVAWQPDLTWDVGFQLSFLGTAAIVLLTPPITARLRRLPEAFREPFAVTLAAQIGTAPLVASDFHVLPLLAPLANALVLPLLPAIVAAGVLLAPLALLPALGHAAALPVAALLTYVEQVAYLLGRVPAAAVAVPALPAAAGLAYYLGLAGAIASFTPGAAGTGRARRGVIVVGVLGPLLIASAEFVNWSLPRSEATALSVGEGEALLLRGPAGFVLVDGGPGAARLHDALGQQIPPWRDELAALLITADGIGHVGGLAGFDRRAAVVGVPGDGLPGTAWRRAALAEVASGARYLPLTGGASLTLAGLGFEILSPEPGEPSDEVGWGDLAFRVAGPDGRSLCDFSDLNADAQRQAAGRLRGGCDFLYFSARAAPDPDLIQQLDPEQLVMSAASGDHNPAGVPSGRLRRTDQEGDVTVAL